MRNRKGKARADSKASSDESDGDNRNVVRCYECADESDADAEEFSDDEEEDALLSESPDREQSTKFGNNGGFAHDFQQAIEALDTTDEASFWDNRWNEQSTKLQEGRSHRVAQRWFDAASEEGGASIDRALPTKWSGSVRLYASARWTTRKRTQEPASEGPSQSVEGASQSAEGASQRTQPHASN